MNNNISLGKGDLPRRIPQTKLLRKNTDRFTHKKFKCVKGDKSTDPIERRIPSWISIYNALDR